MRKLQGLWIQQDSGNRALATPASAMWWESHTQGSKEGTQLAKGFGVN